MAESIDNSVNFYTEELEARGYKVFAPGVITVTISRADFDNLKDDADTLRKLENAGVDNWTWYSEALNHPEDFE